MKKYLALLLALCMIFSLCACASAPAAEKAPAEDEVPAEEAAPAEDEAPAEEGETVKIGVLLPMSGPTSYYGEVQFNGIEFCANYINDNGGVLGGKKIELDLQDSAGDPETGVSAFEMLVEDGCVAVVGPYNSTVAAATAPLAIQYGVPYVVCNATSENFMGEANKYVYRTNVGSTDGDGMWRMIYDYLNNVRPDNPTDKIAVVYDEGDWGAAAVTTWRDNAADWGYEVVVDEAVSESTTDMSVLVNKIKTAETDLIVLAAFSSASNLLCKTLKDYDCPAAVASLGGGVGDTTFIENCGDAAEGVLYTAPWTPTYGSDDADVQALYEDFLAAYETEMTMEPCWGWLAIASVIEAINEADSADREAIADALFAMNLDGDSWVMMPSGYDGVKFNTEGEASEKYGSESGERYNQNSALGETSGMVLTQVKDGAWTVVFPESYTGGEVVIDY